MSTLTWEEAVHLIGRSDLVKSASSNYNFTTRDATLSSWVQAAVSADEGAQEECRKYAAFWKILPECEAASTKIAAYKVPEIADRFYAINVKTAAYNVKKYACVDAETTGISAAAFYEKRAMYPLAWRKTAATHILRAAQTYDAALPAYIETYLNKAAGFAFPNAESVSDAVVCRNNYLDKTASAELQGLLDAFDTETTRWDADLVKTAVDLLDQVDTQYGLNFRYGNGVELPEEICGDTLDALTKTASEHVMITMANGKVLDASALTKEALAVVDPGLAAMDSAELAEVLPTLPKPDADLLTRLIG